MKKLLLNLYFWPIFAFLTLLGVLLVPFILLYNICISRRGAASGLRRAIRIYGWLLVRVVPFMAPVEVDGRMDHLPQPAIYIANHTSAIDPYLFGAIPVENCFVTSWPFKIPIYSPIMKIAGYINTANGWEIIRKQCKDMLDSGVSVIIWPEGHRSRDGSMGRFRKGAFQLAAETGYPLQPVCILGSGDIMMPGERLLSPGRVRLVLLDPIHPGKHTDGDISKQINSLRQQTVYALQQCLSGNGQYLLSSRKKAPGKTFQHGHSFERKSQSHDAC